MVRKSEAILLDENERDTTCVDRSAGVSVKVASPGSRASLDSAMSSLFAFTLIVESGSLIKLDHYHGQRSRYDP